MRSRRIGLAFNSVPLSAQIALRKLQAITTAIGARLPSSAARGNGTICSYSWFNILKPISIEIRLKFKGDSGYFVPLYYTKFQNDGFIRAFLIFSYNKNLNRELLNNPASYKRIN